MNNKDPIILRHWEIRDKNEPNFALVISESDNPNTVILRTTAETIHLSEEQFQSLTKLLGTINFQPENQYETL